MNRKDVLERLARGEITADDAERLLSEAGEPVPTAPPSPPPLPAPPPPPQRNGMFRACLIAVLAAILLAILAVAAVFGLSLAWCVSSHQEIRKEIKSDWVVPADKLEELRPPAEAEPEEE